jgi:hypothetical protein
MTANNDPLSVEFRLSVSGGRIPREGLLVSPVRQTGFLHPAAIAIVGKIIDKCPRAKFALSTLSTDSRVSTKVVRRGKKATTRGVGSG